MAGKFFLLNLLILGCSISLITGASTGSNHRRYRRQVPQEWAHASEVRTVAKFLERDNPLGILHPIFSLLGDDAAAKGLGKLDRKNIDCFQKVIANQAFKNAKKAKDKKGMEAAIIFGSVERNSLGIGKATVACKSMKVDSPEIQRLIQHQDAAGKDAANINKESAKLAALSLNDIGSDPTLALRTGTFKPGDPKNPNKGRGFSCDDENDKEGCIYSKKLLVEDLTKQEIEDFIKKEGGSGGSDASKTDASATTGSGGSDPTKKDAADPTKKDAGDPTKKDPTDPTKKDASDPTKKDASDPTKKDPSDPSKKDSTDPTKKDASATTGSKASDATKKDDSAATTASKK